MEQKSAEVAQRLQVIDPPQGPFAPQPKTKKAVITMAMALIARVLALRGRRRDRHDPRPDDPLPGGT